MHYFLSAFSNAPALILWLTMAANTCAAPHTLFSRPVSSPDRTRMANVQWDDTGFMGRISIQILDAQERLIHNVELPEINPAPSDLLWLDDEWVMVESALGPQASGLFYAHAPSGRGFLLEIVTRSDAEWDFLVSTNDLVCSASIYNASIGRSCLFPILLHDIPDDASAYFRPPFPAALARASLAFCDYRRESGFLELEIVSDTCVRSDLGALLLARFDQEPELVYYPTGTTIPAEMFSRVQRIPVNDEVRDALECPEDIKVVVRWGEARVGDFVIEGVSSSSPPTTTTLMRGHLDGISNAPLPPPPVLIDDAQTTASPVASVSLSTFSRPILAPIALYTPLHTRS